MWTQYDGEIITNSFQSYETKVFDRDNEGFQADCFNIECKWKSNRKGFVALSQWSDVIIICLILSNAPL